MGIKIPKKKNEGVSLENG